MTATPFDSALYRDAFSDPDTARLFSDTAELRAMLLTWGALALAQAKHGLVPETAAHAIQKAALEIQIDPGAISAETLLNGVAVPGLVRAFRAEMKAPEHAAFVHFGATSQDIVDTGLSLRLRQVLGLFETRLGAILARLGSLAGDHADTAMAGRTWGQVATPTTFGAVLAGWGLPLLELRQDLDSLRSRSLRVSLSGAAGTLSVLHPYGMAVRADLAAGLGLEDPQHSWHSIRLGRARLGAWMTHVCGQLGKLGDDIVLMASSDRGEIRLAGAGGSSTMPQKQNPVPAALLGALARHAIGLNTTLQQACIHHDQRDGAAWMTEWLTLPQLCCATGKALALAEEICQSLTPDTDRMLANIDDGTGLIFAEALSFQLAQTMSRPDAQEAVKELCRQTKATGTPLPDLARQAWPDRDMTAAFVPQPGLAPIEAAAFSKAVTP